jgi:acyl carrier protein
MNPASALGELWKQSLGVEQVGPDDNFFALGGDSISAMILLAQIEERFGVMPDPGLIYDHPIFSQMLGALDLSPRPTRSPAFGGLVG